MVIGDRFAWGHLEKTGGDATLQLFEQVPDLVRFADPVDAHDKHRSFAGREAEVRGKVLALNIRRLPAWILSKAQHAARHGTYPDYEPWYMASPHEIAHSTEPDERLAAFTGDGRFAVDRWLRVEHLADDFLAFVTSSGRSRSSSARRSRTWRAFTAAPPRDTTTAPSTGSRRSSVRAQPGLGGPRAAGVRTLGDHQVPVVGTRQPPRSLFVVQVRVVDPSVALDTWNDTLGSRREVTPIS